MALTAEYRLLVPRAAWMTARSRNAMRRPVFIGAVSIGTFVTALVALVVMPQQAQRAARTVRMSMPKPDTSQLINQVRRAESAVNDADSGLAAARIKSALLAQSALDTLNPTTIARRDSLAARVADLDRLLGRAESSPLTASYRALAESPSLANSSRVRALLDSLTDIEKERDALGTSSGADPVFVALTSRANEIGRSIQAIGAARRDAISREIASLSPPPRSSLMVQADADTVQALAERDEAVSALGVANAELGRVRRVIQDIDRREARARQAATLNAPPYALLASAIVFGIVLGFGVALIGELRRPRISDAREVERIAGVRVLSVIRPRQPSPERGRRLADRLAPPYIDPGNDAHQLAWLSVAPPPSSLLMLTVSGEDAAVTAVVAANLAAVAAEEARNVILIDTDATSNSVAAALRLRARPGIVEIIDAKLNWPEVTQHATIGRDRAIDVVPSGIGLPAPEATEVIALLQRDAAWLARHYDTVIIVASKEQVLSGLPGVLPMKGVLHSARVCATPLNVLRRTIEDARTGGGQPVGIVLWDDVLPALLTPEEMAAGPPPHRTAEMEAFVSGRVR